MSTTMAVFCLLASVYAMTSLVIAFSRIRRRRLYASRVGLRLGELVGLLPDHLADRSYTEYVVVRTTNGSIEVALLFKDGILDPGHDPNVGLEFDAQSGALLRIHESGINRGIK